MRHLSDDMIQEYLDSKAELHAQAVESHLVLCPECKEKLEHYQELYGHLAVEEELQLGTDFNRNILKAIEPAEAKKAGYQYLYSIAAAVTVMVALFVLNYLEIISLSTIAQDSFVVIKSWVLPTAGFLVNLVAKLNGHLEYLAFAALAILIFQLLDISLVQGKFRKT